MTNVLSNESGFAPYFFVFNTEDPLAFKAITTSPLHSLSARAMSIVWVKSKNKHKTSNKQSNMQKKDESRVLYKGGKKSAGSRRVAKWNAKTHRHHGSCATENFSRADMQSSSHHVMMRMK